MMPSSPLNLRRAIIWIGRLVLAGIFIYAGYAKLTMGRHPRPPIGVALSFFALQVDSYQILPSWGVKFVANTLPFAEIGLGLLLLIGWRFRIWATLVTLIMLGFFAAVIRSYALGLQINCRCVTDAVALVANCRLGKRALKFRDWGKVAATFVDLQTGRAVRIAAKESSKQAAREMFPEFGKDAGQQKAYAQLSDEILFDKQW